MASFTSTLEINKRNHYQRPPESLADGLVALVADMAVDTKFTACGHVHPVAAPDFLHDLSGHPRGVPFYLPERCAAIFLARFTGRIDGLRRVE